MTWTDTLKIKDIDMANKDMKNSQHHSLSLGQYRLSFQTH